METDPVTLKDLNIFAQEERSSIFDKINCTLTSNGESRLIEFLSLPHSDIEKITETQEILKHFITVLPTWPMQISNGTVMVVEKFYDTHFDAFPAKPSAFQSLLYSIFSKHDFTLLNYSLSHCIDFINGIKNIISILQHDENPAALRNIIEEIHNILDKEELSILDTTHQQKLSKGALLKTGYFLRFRFKHQMQQLLQYHATLDAWYSMAKATDTHNLVFPEMISSEIPIMEADQLYHLLLDQPVPYDVRLGNQEHFMFLTGANMAGKSTFIKAVGSAVFLAHTGMGVPAQQMRISALDGLLSNINITDNLAKGESFFYNEVQRIKSTITKINDGRKWLVLIDELFKGTNVDDAMKCSKIVIDGLSKISSSIIILSTHLYELNESLRPIPGIQFNYFATHVIDDEFSFSYQLQPGVSNDRLGYLILKKEGVVRMLENIAS
jgi:DNA mismatch repair protein MutS